MAAKKNLQCTCVKTQKWMCIRNTHVKPPTDITRQMQESSACEKSSHSIHLPPILTSAALCTLGAHPFQSPRTPCLLMMLEKACEVLRTLSHNKILNMTTKANCVKQTPLKPNFLGSRHSSVECTLTDNTGL